MRSQENDRVAQALEVFRIEIPSWGFANTGTRFGKFTQAAAATTIEEKLSDAGQVHLLTGVCPTVALHVLWDFPDGIEGTNTVNKLAERYGIRPGSINPNLFQDQNYKYGSFGNPDPAIRKQALQHVSKSIEIAERLNSRDISLWFADGSNYPGTANIRQRKKWFEECLRASHAELADNQRMLLEYKPFEPAFYHTDVADWENMLGGFHFNDRRYADDDLTIGSIDPYQVFRIFHEIVCFEWETEKRADIAYMIDQSHNLKGKIEAMIQTVTMAQQLYSKAALVDHEQLSEAQRDTDLVRAESILQDAFATDVRPAIQEWRVSKGLPTDPLKAFRENGYLQRITKERTARNARSVSSYA